MFVLDPSAGETTVETVVKKSRFIATLAAVDDEDGFGALLTRVKAAHPTARHACWAFTAGSGPYRVERCSDDGEPAGTAGPPILSTLHSRELVGAGVVVIRYFGGVKLGAGGLIRAYGSAAAAALDAAPLRQARPVSVLRIVVPLDDAGRVETMIRAFGAVRAAEYGAASAEFAVAVDTPAEEGLRDRLLSLTSGAAQVVDVVRTLA
ncbi:MAG: YigZ family protein [Gordonia sp. (in: high G+C Gram-positive bacteria)]